MNMQFGKRAFEREQYRATVTELWNAGKSPADIAAHIGKNIRTFWRMAERYDLPKREIRSTEDRELVSRMWADGASLDEIGAAVNLGRKATSKLVRRMGLPHRRVKSGPKPRPRPVVIAPPAIGPIGDFPAGDACRFIAGEPRGDFQCCGQPGFPYCDFHKAICISPRKIETSGANA